MEIGSKIKFAYNDSQGIRRQGIDILTSDIMGKDTISDEQVIERLTKSLQKYPKSMLVSSGFLLAARFVLKKDPDATNIDVDEARENQSGGNAGGAILFLAVLAFIVAIIVFPLLVILGMHNKLFLKGFYNKYEGEKFKAFTKNYTYIGIGLYALVAVLVIIDNIFKLYALTGPAFGILFIGGIAYFVISLLLIKKNFAPESEKINVIETIKESFKKKEKKE